jgi:hypothetical protein
MKITELQISVYQQDIRGWKRWLHLFQDQYEYIAQAIKFDGQYFYRANQVTVEINQYEYEHVIQNPKLYYFSSALKLHHRIRKAKELGLGLAWPKENAAPIHIFDV